MVKRHIIGGLAFLVFTTITTLSSANEQQPAADGEKELTELEQKFQNDLSGAILTGAFTVDGKQDGKPPREERYEIKNVSKLRGDYWVFTARVKYGETDITVPITLQVVWAGDTPMISMTNLAIPGLGTFTCRVMFYDNRYAGTWQHGEVGGHMFGRYEKNAAGSDKPVEKSE